MNELRKYNLNNYVHVHLDDKGKQIFKDYYIGFVDVDIDDHKSDKKEGYYKFQFWNFIDIFAGSSCGSYSPYSVEVYLEEKDL